MDYAAVLPKQNIQNIVSQWISEDMPTFDIGGLVVGSEPKCAHLYLKSPGVFAGKPFMDAIFEELGCTIQWMTDVAREGNYVSNASSQNKVLLAVVRGPANALLRGERTALNTLSRCSGVATQSYLSKQRIAQTHPDWKGAIAGTRKTTPGSFRIVEKYGLLVGGVNTHRLDLSQMTMLKDNHIWSAGSITRAVQNAKNAAGFSTKIEVECQNLEEALEACEAGADIVMLDNYTPDKLKVDAKVIKEHEGCKFKHVIIEASGGITFDTMTQYISDHVDILSRGDLTQGYSCLDYSLKIQKEG
mmetsp:Transcript_10480/g.14804  ORF Transcript_10480/g.14804 Transcript_10480/m.14804 type:complete len:302 (+) Transcript_10480:106-1011(+)|eukprot:CAMPEP_0184863744 /NCGR_PEP_ID=MMETSP0580-20130426/12243_1 /TAXON_ID=1118495 /ORGANISM="Dactyliosolen fragilissimus" /LENGTH=301 /DNA_ID=CAMNT_0027362239 /DNA_START=40 /DNA_END=942 /DNA_ORIENTATION=-